MTRRSQYVSLFLTAVTLSMLFGIARAGSVSTEDTDARPKCWAGDTLLRAALRDGFHIGAEARSEMFLTEGVKIYFAFDDDHHFGIIGSAVIDGQPRQCNLGKADAWQAATVEMVPAIHEADSIKKSLTTCASLPPLLDRTKESFLEVPIGRARISDEFDSVLTAAENGSWSIFLVDKRDKGGEVACFANWGIGFLLKDPRFMMQAER